MKAQSETAGAHAHAAHISCHQSERERTGHNTVNRNSLEAECHIYVWQPEATSSSQADDVACGDEAVTDNEQRFGGAQRVANQLNRV